MESFEEFRKSLHQCSSEDDLSIVVDAFRTQHGNDIADKVHLDARDWIDFYDNEDILSKLNKMGL